jgi:predicted AAA+ superfamily ATPase
MKEAFLIFEKTMLFRLVYPVTDTNLPLAPGFKKKPRLHLLDTGLVNYKLDMLGEMTASKLINDVFRGRIAEHIVGQELLTASFSVLYSLNFWTREKKESGTEVDYVVAHKGMLIPVEVKAGQAVDCAHCTSLWMQRPTIGPYACIQEKWP